jgi:hypothetical protein
MKSNIIAELEKRVIEKCDYFVDFGLWPTSRKIDYLSWLNNFSDLEKYYALILLSKFIYVNDDICNENFKDSFIKAGQIYINIKEKYNVEEQWKWFFENCIVCPVRGERPSLADSGYTYIQKTRNLLGIKEGQFMEPDEALRNTYKSFLYQEEYKPIIFVDDFIGSGSQFYSMWTKVHNMFNIEEHSFLTLAAEINYKNFFYCCVIGTSNGIKKLKKYCPKVNFCVSQEIDMRSSIFENNSEIWRGKEKAEGIKMLQNKCNLYNMPDTGGVDEYDWKGFDEQGLLIGIREKAPDATIAAIRWDKFNWIPLIKI